MLLPAHNHFGYVYTNDSDPTGGAGTTLTAGATANVWGSWTQIGPVGGLSYPTGWVLIELNTGFVGASTRNSYVDIAIGPDTANLLTICEKLCGAGASGNLGKVYLIPIRIPPDQQLWARTVNTVGTSTIKICISVMGGNQLQENFPTISQVVCLGATTATTSGTAITMGASGAEGAWTQIVASTADDYAGLLIGGPFCVDTAMTAGPSYTFDAGVGASGQEMSVGENLTKATIVSANEDWASYSVPTLVGIPAGSRLVVRGSCSGVSETSISVVLYGLKH